MPTATSPRRPLRSLAQLLAVAITAAGLILGIWLAGGFITDDFGGSIALTTVWMAVAAGLCLAITVPHRQLRVPVLATYVVTAGIVGVFLASTTLRDRVVDEQVVTATPTRDAPAAPAQASP